MFLNNIAQLVSSLGGGGSPAVYVSVFSVSSCVGRLLLGCHFPSSHICQSQILPFEDLVQVALRVIAMSVRAPRGCGLARLLCFAQLLTLSCRYGPEALQHRRGVPRPLFLVLTSLLSAAVALACAFAPLPALVPAAVFAGIAFGAHWSLIPALASELFGLRFFASNYCLLQVGFMKNDLPNDMPSCENACLMPNRQWT